MKHLTSAMVALSRQPNPSIYQKTIAVSDFYWGEDDFPYPMGFIQNTGNVLPEMIPAEAPPFLSSMLKLTEKSHISLYPIYQVAAQHSTGWWFQTEDLPNPNNRVQIKEDKLHLDYTPNNSEAGDRLVTRWTEILKKIDRAEHTFPLSIYPRNKMPLQVVGHQCGTCRFGNDRQTSVLDINCRTHDLENLYVVDGSFFPSSAAVNPTLTIMANALRVGDRLWKKLI